MAGAFHGVGEADVEINVGVSGPGVVKRALEKSKENLLTSLQKQSKTAFKITRMGQLVGRVASERLGFLWDRRSFFSTYSGCRG